MNNLIITLGILFISHSIYAQDDPLHTILSENATARGKQVNVYTSGYYSPSYYSLGVTAELELAKLAKSKIFGKAGYNHVQIGWDRGFSIGVSQIFGKKSSHFEYSLGAHYFFDTDDNDEISYFSPSSWIFPMLEAGYRYQKPDGGFIFRTGVGITGLYFGLGYGF